MPDELDGIRQRLDSLESRVVSESGLRAMMDADQASRTVRLDAQDNLLRALSITQSDHTSQLTRLEEGQRRLEGTVGRLEGTVTRQETTIGHVEAGIQTIITLLRDAH
jgi:tetrahydromethanopterin S-methyltransferase subunit G